MRKVAFLAGMLTVSVSAVATAKEFPLEFKVMTSQEAMAAPGGYGAYGQLQAAKPANLKKEPKANSVHPIYGQLNPTPGGSPTLFRIDESKGEGKGYDQLIIDLNQNGDLTDDPVAKPATTPEARSSQPGSVEHVIFGAIEASSTQVTGIWRPMYFAEMYLYNRQFGTMGNMNSYLGNLRVKPACYLEANIELEGITQKIGIMDGNGNAKLGDMATPMTYRSTDGENWTFQAGDLVLRDRNGNGKFESDQFDSESEFLAKLMYFGPNPYTVKFAPDFKFISLEPFTGQLGELAIQPRGNQIRNLTLAREITSGQWEAFNPSVVEGKAKVPPGNYRLYSLLLTDKDSKGNPVMAGGYKRTIKDSIKVEAGQMAALKCGAPLELKVTANKQTSSSMSSGGGLMGAAISLFSGRASGPPELNINMAVTGAGGESYSGYVKGANQQTTPRPSFKVFAEDGKQIASGNLEFG